MFARHATLEADTVLEVELDGRYAEVEVLIRAEAAEVYFTLDGTDPTVGGDDTWAIPAVLAAREVGSGARPSRAANASDPATVVKLISTGTPEISVHASKEWEDAR